MSGSYVDCAGLAEEWDGMETIRNRLRKGEHLLSEKGGKDVKIPRCVENYDVLTPILVQIATGCRLAEIDGLRDSVAQAYRINHQEADDHKVDDAAWGIRDMVTFIKKKTQRREPSKDPVFQSLCILLNPGLEADTGREQTDLEKGRNAGAGPEGVAVVSPPTRVPSPQQKDLPAVPAATVGEAPAVVAAAEKQVIRQKRELLASAASSAAKPAAREAAELQGGRSTPHFAPDNVETQKYQGRGEGEKTVHYVSSDLDDHDSQLPDGYFEQKLPPIPAPKEDAQALGVEAETGADVFCRRDQLSLRSKGKDANKNKKNAKKNAKEPPIENEDKADIKGAAKTKKGKTATKKTETPESAAKASSSRRAKKGDDKSSTSAKAKAAPGRRQSQSKRKAGNSDDTSKPPKRKQTPKVSDGKQYPQQQEDIIGWVQHNNLDWQGDLDSFKASVKLARSQYTYFRLSIYWKTFACGLVMKTGGGPKEVAHFKFESTQRGCLAAYYMDDCPADTLEEFQEELDLVKQSLTEASMAPRRGRRPQISHARREFILLILLVVWTGGLYELNQVSRISWWMSSFGSATAKPQYAYSNSPSIRRVHQYAPTTSVERTGEHVETCRAYKNKEGRVCYTGTKNLKSTEIYPDLFGLTISELVPHLKADKCGSPKLPDLLPPAIDSIRRSTFGHGSGLFDHADLSSPYRYLRKGHHLSIPKEWEREVPKSI
ncbi:Uncharacterized protein SCF082_LOCUS2903 [Durusdinium trenchii]|uniref:Uncharacterized protein n=1 Tax=Durusdinium trenchii TaxID=1381693 RepID=A0ABP0HQY8_9DINO